MTQGGKSEWDTSQQSSNIAREPMQVERAKHKQHTAYLQNQCECDREGSTDVIPSHECRERGASDDKLSSDSSVAEQLMCVYDLATDASWHCRGQCWNPSASHQSHYRKSGTLRTGAAGGI